jgi:hypothetical protein
MPAQPGGQKKLNLATGKDIFLAACVGCHGPDGKGAPDPTPPIVDGGLPIGVARGFSRIMPSFSEALTAEQIDMVAACPRGFRKDNSWPRGELNFPRAMFTEKAFPESGIVMTTTASLGRATRSQ